eukprot:14945556-Alexandrium_andersonii.AAC.1
MLRPQRQRDTGSLRLSSSNPTALTLPRAATRSSSNRRGAPACSRNHAAISAPQPSAGGAQRAASRVNPCSQSARGFQSLAAVP